MNGSQSFAKYLQSYDDECKLSGNNKKCSELPMREHL